MTTQMINLRQSRTFDEVLGDTFVFMRTMLKPFLRSVLPIAGPFLVLAAIFSFATTMSMQDMGGILRGGSSGGSMGFLSAWELVTVSAFISSMGYFVLFASGSAFMVLYARHGNQPPTPAEVRAYTMSNFFRLLGTGIASTFVSGLAFVLLILPGIYVTVALWIIFIVRLQEHSSVSGAINRCFDLVKGYWWQTLGVFLILQLLSSVADLVVGLLPELVERVAPASLIGDGAYTVLTAFFTTGSIVFSMLTYIPLIIAPAIQYYNLVERKEAVGLQERISEMEYPSDDDVATGSSSMQ